MARLCLACVFVLGLVSSCERGMVKEPKGPQFTEIHWDVPFAQDVIFDGPTLAALVDHDTLLYLYRTGKKTGKIQSKVCLVTLSTGLCRCLEYPYNARVGRISDHEIAVKHGFGHEARETPWAFVDVASLKERVDANIPSGRYFPNPGVDSVIGGEDEDEIWLRDRATGQEYTLSASKHGLERELWIAIAPERILLTGWPDDVDTFWLPRTQLWSFPEPQKIAEHQTSHPWSWEVLPLILGDLFVHPSTPGVLQVATLEDGQPRFVLGQPPATAEIAEERNGGIALVADTSGYVRETGVILTLEQITEDHVALNAYNIMTGAKVRTAPMQSKKLDDLCQPIDGLWVRVTQVGEEWVLFEQMTNPRDDPERGSCRMRLIPYRIRDFKRAAKPIDFAWGCFLKPIVDGGRLIVPGNDHVRICSLSDLVDFDGE